MIFGLADKFGYYDPFEMVESAPDYVLHHWIAYRKLSDPEYRKGREWELMDETEFVAKQTAALKDHLTRLGQEAEAHKT